MKNENQPNVSLSIQIIPKVANNLSSYAVVDKCIETIQKSGFKYEVGPMETTIEGPLPELLLLLQECQSIAFESGALETITFVKIHARATNTVTIEEKIKKYRA